MVMSEVRPYIEFPDKREWAAGLLGLAPFIINLGSTTMTSSNGQVTSFNSMDYADIILGALCVVIMLTTIRYWPQTRPEAAMKRKIVFVVLIGLGIFQVLSGLGLFTRI
jgi:hypothetical protein